MRSSMLETRALPCAGCSSRSSFSGRLLRRRPGVEAPASRGAILASIHVRWIHLSIDNHEIVERPDAAAGGRNCVIFAEITGRRESPRGRKRATSEGHAHKPETGVREYEPGSRRLAVEESSWSKRGRRSGMLDPDIGSVRIRWQRASASAFVSYERKQRLRSMRSWRRPASGEATFPSSNEASSYPASEHSRGWRERLA